MYCLPSLHNSHVVYHHYFDKEILLYGIRGSLEDACIQFLFIWNKELFSNMLSSSKVGTFTKLHKPIYVTLRSNGFTSCENIDESHLQGQTVQCRHNVEYTCALFQIWGSVRIGTDLSLFTLK